MPDRPVYLIVEGASSRELSINVTKWRRAGFRFVGGVCVDGATGKFYQAIEGTMTDELAEQLKALAVDMDALPQVETAKAEAN